MDEQRLRAIIGLTPIKAANGRSLDIRVYWRVCVLQYGKPGSFSNCAIRASITGIRYAAAIARQNQLGVFLRTIRLSKPRTRLQQHYIARWALGQSGQHLAELADSTI